MKKLAAAFMLAASAQSAMAGEIVTLMPGTERAIKAYVAGPEEAERRVLILHDWFGLTPSTMAEAEWFGKRGVRATAIDLYGGKAADTHKAAEALMNGLDRKTAAVSIKNALGAIGAGKTPVTVIGYSMGGAIALEAKLDNPSMINGAALVYGGGYEEIAGERLKASRTAILIVTGSQDEWSVPAMEALQKRMSAFGRPIETYVYPAVGHAYAQSLFNNGRNYDFEAAMATRNVIENFVGRAAGAPG
jgi:carboxymethylenebutenolidase